MTFPDDYAEAVRMGARDGRAKWPDPIPGDCIFCGCDPCECDHGYPQWQSEPPTEPGWYRVVNMCHHIGCMYVFRVRMCSIDKVLKYSKMGQEIPVDGAGYMWDTRKIEFLSFGAKDHDHWEGV